SRTYDKRGPPLHRHETFTRSRERCGYPTPTVATRPRLSPEGWHDPVRVLVSLSGADRPGVSPSGRHGVLSAPAATVRRPSSRAGPSGAARAESSRRCPTLARVRSTAPNRFAIGALSGFQ